MACPDRLSQWTTEVSTTFSHLSKPQLWGLVLWSAGIALSGVAGITQISALLAIVLQEPEQTVFERLREWYLDAGQKSGKKRREFEVSRCFAPLLGWVLRLWSSEKRQFPLVMDATSLGNRWTILVISVVLRGCAIPVAWKVLPAEQAGSWRPYWEELLTTLGTAVPPEWEVIVLADRGLYARWLWDAIVAWGWHPFLRLNVGCKARLLGEENFEWLSRWMPTPGTSWQGKVECFASKQGRVNGTLLMHWEPGYESAWIILTDLEPEEALVSWYGLRTWIEIVQMQMTKANVFTVSRGRDHIADLYLFFRHDDQINQQLNQQAFLFKSGLFESLLDPLTKGLHRLQLLPEILRLMAASFELTSLGAKSMLPLFKIIPTPLVLFQLDDLSKISGR